MLLWLEVPFDGGGDLVNHFFHRQSQQRQRNDNKCKTRDTINHKFISTFYQTSIRGE